MLGKGSYRQIAALGMLIALALPGCSPFRNAIPAQAVKENVLESPRGSKEPINFTLLRQPPPSVYLLGPKDILGIFVEGVLGKQDEPPPVHFPEQPDVPPSIGFPMPIRDDGTISLPLVPPITLTGLTIAQAENLVRETYTITYRILPPDKARIIVTLMKPRTYNVLVVREDTTFSGAGVIAPTSASRAAPGFEPERHGLVRQVELRAYENDVLHALSESGGLPGIDAKNEVIIVRGGMSNPQVQDQMQRGFRDQTARAQLFASANIVRIPIRLAPDEKVRFCPDDVILNNGDVIFVESRTSEVFYTGGLLPGRQIPVPRDYDLDVLAAIAMAGGSIAAGAGANPAGAATHGGVGSIFPPTRVVVVRTVNGKMKAIKLSLKTALLDPKQRILIQPNDFVLLEYTEFELTMNILLNNVNLNLDLNTLFAH